jgi:chromosome segregation ATPase
MITTQVSDVATSRREQMRQESAQEVSKAQETKAKTSTTTQSQTDYIATSASGKGNVSQPVQAQTSAIELRNARQNKRSLESQLANEKVKEPKNQRKIEELEKKIETISNRIAMLEARVGS